MNNTYILGIYKEVGKEPQFRKIINKKSYIEKLVNGEYTSFDYNDYCIIFKKKNENLLPNIYIDKYSKIGKSIKGNIYIVGKDKNNNFISLNKNQFLKVTKFLMKESFNYKNFDKYGRYVSTARKNHTKNNQANVSLPHSTNINENSQELILKILFTILGFIKNSTDDSSNEQK